MRYAFLFLTGCLALAACGQDAGYRDPGTLAGRLSRTAQARMDRDPEMYKHAKVVETKCVETSQVRVFKCSGEIDSGQRWTVSVTVSSDGRTYVSEQP